MTTNARDEKWSEWRPWSGGVCPLPDGTMHEVEFRTGEHVLDDLPETSYWGCDGDDGDIIAYRYKIKEPESDMHPDLEWLARYVDKWNEGRTFANVHRNHLHSAPTLYWSDFTEDDHKVTQWTKPSWIQARKDLDLDAIGIADPEEEECIQLAYERMNEESVKVSIEELQDNVNKPKHYQLREGYEVYDLRQDLAAKAANGGATYDQYSDWDRAIEYIIRMWGKNRLEDAKKGRWYLDKLIGKLEAEE